MEPGARIGGRAGRWIGVVLLVQYAILVASKIHFGTLPELWWNSHVALLMAGVGLLVGSTLLVTVPLTATLLAHAGWTVDALIGLSTGHYPLGMAHYLADCSLFVWMGTIHHLYLAPLLLVLVLRHGRYPAVTIPATILLIAALTVISRIALDRGTNINTAFLFLPAIDHPINTWMNRQGAVVYLLSLNAFMAGVLVLPVGVVLGRRCADEEGLSPRRAVTVPL